ncbi:MAG TPA: class F sortase [Streptosporangiaceae bacterium]
MSGVAVAAAGLTGLAVMGFTARPGFRLDAIPSVQAPAGPAARPAAALADRQVARPVSLVIPAIGVSTPLVRLGLTATGALQVPPVTTEAGWYTGSPRPGAVGPAVIAGHIDSYQGPGVFYRLRLLRPGDLLYVRRADGSVARFRVTALRTYLKRRFPTRTVYGPAPGPQLRLISCGGTFDPELRSYLSDVVVYAVAAS